ncbi:MAG: hypothetical protein NVSMB55_00760 [Mycobacteriales bacterium]
MRVREVEDAFFRLDPEFLALTETVLATDPHPRVHLLRAGIARSFGLPVDPVAELDAAGALGPGAVDASLLACLRRLLIEGPGAAADALCEHGASYPDDLAGGFFRTMALVMGGLRGGRDRARALSEEEYGRHGDDWRIAGSRGMSLQEQHRYDEARAVAERGLTQEPRAGHAVHALAHVNYETGEHGNGLQWLDSWQRENRVLGYQAHFVWHTTLHALAQGDVAQALARYESGIGPASVIDAGPLLWRCHLAGSSTEGLGREAVNAAQPVLDGLPLHFPVFNACFALASAGDTDGLAALAGRLEADPRPAFADLVAPVARSMLALLQDQPHAAVEILDRILDDLPRVGGSNAQREVVEDTLLHALVLSGRNERAIALLQRRLERRPHALDLRLLDRAGAA